MKLHRFFVQQNITNTDPIILTHTPLVNQIRNVLRLGVGSEIVLFDTTETDCLVFINKIDKDKIFLTPKKIFINSVKATREIYLFISMVKKDKFEWILEKATELGVSHVIPLISNRTEKKDFNGERAEKIVIEAAEQSGRSTIPKVDEIVDLETALANYNHLKSIAWHTNAPKFVSQDLRDVQGIYIGPEGGWTVAEEELFKAHNIPLRSLGPQVLRSETAVIATLSQLVF